MDESTETIAVGIDLGTTNSCVAILKDGTVEIIEDEHGNKTIPSMFTYADDNTTFVGWDSFNQAHMYPYSTVYEAKRLMGQNFDSKEIQKIKTRWAYKIINDDNLIQIRLGDTEFYPQEISGRILEKLKKVAEDFTGKKATKAVITVPAYFVDTQREATIVAAILAGFESAHTINEPTAAALAFQHNNPKDKKRNILIYDFGGGTFDVTIAEVEKRNCNVLATKGDCFLGGINVDMNIATYIKLNATIPIPENDVKIQRRLKTISEDAKKSLSNHPIYTVDAFGSTSICITKEIFEDINKKLFDKTIEIAKQCVKDARLKLNEIDEVVPIGGSTRIPKVQEMLKETFRCHIAKTINPDEAVAYGAALYAANKFGNSDEITVKDVLSLSLGIEIDLGEMHFLLKRNTSVPCEHVEQFKISSPEFMIKLYQGESKLVKNNHYLGQCIIGVVHKSTTIKIKFCFDKDAILTVSAESDHQTELKIDMTKHKLSEEQENKLKMYEENRESESMDLEFIRKKKEFDFYCESLKRRLENHHRRKILEGINAFKKKIAKFSPTDINENRECINKINEFMNSLQGAFNKPKTSFFQRLSSLKF